MTALGENPRRVRGLDSGGDKVDYEDWHGYKLDR
jgi:hypothetical protein